MSDARKQVLDQIRKKAKKINEIRTNSSRKMSYEEVIFNFFKEIEEIYVIAKDTSDFQRMLDTRSNLLDSRMRSFDPGIALELIWNETQNWKELRLQGVKIQWSDTYLKANPLESKDLYWDVVNVLIS